MECFEARQYFDYLELLIPCSSPLSAKWCQSFHSPLSSSNGFLCPILKLFYSFSVLFPRMDGCWISYLFRNFANLLFLLPEIKSIFLSHPLSIQTTFHTKLHNDILNHSDFLLMVF